MTRNKHLIRNISSLELIVPAFLYTLCYDNPATVARIVRVDLRQVERWFAENPRQY